MMWTLFNPTHILTGLSPECGCTEASRTEELTKNSTRFFFSNVTLLLAGYCPICSWTLTPTSVSPCVDNNFLKFLKFRSLNLGSWNQKYLVAIEKYFDWFDLGVNFVFNCKSPGNADHRPIWFQSRAVLLLSETCLGFLTLGCCSAVSWLWACVCVLFIILAQRSYDIPTINLDLLCASRLCLS